jgi:predicted phosphatase
MKKWILFLLLAFCKLLLADIHVVDSLSPIESALEDCDSKTLLILDAGETLMTARDAVLHPEHNDWKQRWFKKHFPRMSREEQVALIQIVRSDGSIWELVDDAWPDLIADAQNRGAQVLVLTKNTVDPKLKGLTAMRLIHLGLPIKNDSVIETEAPLKGPVLIEVLKQLSFQPEQIIFVDDRLEQIKSLDEACRQAQIPCIAFHLIAMQKTHLFNEKIADYQFKTLVKERRWVSDDEAAKTIPK